MAQKPIDIPTNATVSFIVSVVPRGASIIEVGCGEGHVARRLLQCGYPVTGVESDEDAASRARDKGVNVVCAAWSDVVVGPADAILFTRSLHHIHLLDDALRKARDLLLPGGRLIVEDFAFDKCDQRAARWLHSATSQSAAEALMDSDADEFLQAMLATDDPLQVWREFHDHHLHSATTMSTAIDALFLIESDQSVPYLYRYLVPGLRCTPGATVFIEEVLQEESRRGQNGELSLIGRRFVATAKRVCPADH